METANVFNQKPDEEKTNLSAPLEGEFVNPHADTEDLREKLPGDEITSSDGKLVGTDDSVNDKDSSLTADTDTGEAIVTDI
nr:hypothetical protein [uncultured Mucilaginibacter sp.]